MVVEGCLTGDCRQDLTSSEKEVLHLLTAEFLTPQKIMIRRKCSQQAVSKIICSLKKKGALTTTLKAVVKTQSTKQPSQPKHQIRLHGQEFNIDILYKDERYNKTATESNTIIEDGNTLRLYKDSIEVYSGQFFYADDAQKATANSFIYWNRFFTRLEHRLNIIIVKSGNQNIKLVNHHYAEINNELARDVNIKADRIRVYANEDGKLWFNIDNSFNLNEAEAQHPGTAKQDIQKVVNVFNDIRDNPHYPLSDLSSNAQSTTTNISKLSEIAEKQLQISTNILQMQMNNNQMFGSEEILNKKKDGYERPLNTYFG
jgi:hypothetical protein